MSWGNAWAWFGLAALAVPVLIHMLGRRKARVLPFPTLRFLEASRLQPVRRTRVQDLALLALRLLILALAVAALAQPLVRTDARENARAASLARVVMVDTSASMVRGAVQPTTGPAADPASAVLESAATVARREARRVAQEATTSIVVETAAPARSLAGAVAWLRTQSGPGEIEVISDFQIGTIDSAMVEAVPPEFGLRMRRIDITDAVGPIEIVASTGETETISRVTLTDGGSAVEWSVRPATGADAAGPLLLAGDGGRLASEASLLAARRIGRAVRFDADRPVAIVFSGHEERNDLLRVARPIALPWMAETIRRVRRDDLFEAANILYGENVEGEWVPELASSPDPPFVIIGSDATGRATAVAAQAAIDGRERLVFFVGAGPGSLMAAALIGAIGSALSPARPVAELEPTVMSDAMLATWERSPSGRTTSAPITDASDARWFWLAVIALLGIESVYRRSLRHARRSGSDG